ncbi:MAG: molecular chaperone Skp [Negativicutes bacterium]|nr:molecular chaperone Skp [Negativicutes bacterium]
MKNRAEFCFLAMLILAVGIVAGCGSKSAQDTKNVQPSVGFMDVQNAVKNHPRYATLQRLQQEYDALAAQVEAAKQQSGRSDGPGLPAPIDGTAALNEAAGQEFNAKMASRQQELKTQLETAGAEQRQALQTELDAYVQELDKTYQPQILSIQLKLKTVQLSKEEMAAQQTELERLQNERAARISARQQDLAKQMDQAMAAKQDEILRQLKAYGQELNTAIAGKMSAQQPEPVRTIAPPVDGGPRSDQEQQLALKKQEIIALQDFIMNDIKTKAAKVAVEKGLEVVFSDIKANVNAVDVTAAVIAEFKK